jgi:hypothetical protein
MASPWRLRPRRASARQKVASRMYWISAALLRTASAWSRADVVVLVFEGLLGEEHLGLGHVAGVGIFLEEEFEVGDAGLGHAVFDPGAAEPDEGFGAEVVGLEAAGEDGELAGLLVGREELGFGPGEARGEGEALAARAFS